MNAKLPHAQRRFRARRHVGSLGLGNFTSAHCALIWKTHKKARTEVALAAPLRLVSPGALRTDSKDTPMSATTSTRAASHSAAPPRS